MTKMFDVITHTWNPITGCQHTCRYCWARRLAETKLKSSWRYKHGFSPRLNLKEFHKPIPKGQVFVSDMGDMFGNFIPDEWIERVLRYISHYLNTQFFFLTKNPRRYNNFLDLFPTNVVLGATIETDISSIYNDISNAPLPEDRLVAMMSLNWNPKFISIEPILKFDEYFAQKLLVTCPSLIYVGYDNYGHHLPEPRLSETLQLIDQLEERGLTVHRKNLRKAWNE